jgi:hypothetical protein
MVIKDIVGQVTERLTRILAALNNTQIIADQDITIKSDDFRAGQSLSEVLDQFHNSTNPIIYRISCESYQERKLLINTFRDFVIGNRKNQRGKDRINVSKFNDTSESVYENQTLYIGSTMYNIKSRIKQHLGSGYFRTYSMHLSKWDNGLDYTIRIKTYQVVLSISNINKQYLTELLEQELWDYYKPVFGKRSGL